jgi:3-hydroxyacyl-CoA dehydrogenase
MWAIGPFESWDAIGLKESVERMQQEGRKVPQNVLDILAKGYTSFYEVVESKRRYYDFTSQEMRFVPDNPKLIELPLLKNVKANILKKNASASLINIGDGVLCLEFHSKMNSIDEQIIKMMHEAIDEVEQNWEGLVIANQGENFSVGANLFMILGEAMQGNYDRIELGVKQLQYANQRLKYSDKPVVAAPHKMVLGGGCEVCLGADRIVANAETYMGLVEVGAGLIPGGGGTKEMILRQIGRVPSHMEVDLMPYLKAAFEVVGMAKVSFSAEMARELGFLKPSDTITLNLSHLIYDAKQMVLGMVKAGYRAPKPRTDIRMPGEHALAAIQAYLYSMKCGNFISEHDMLIGLKLAKVLTGGKATPRYPVDEDYLLDLEREAFMSLVGEPKTHERMQNLLIKGKPLRN